ncbi:MAG: c-type cytochrome [Gammaproteobacteria bacterium]
MIKQILLVGLLLWSTAAMSAGQTGATLFENNCAVCHGEHGKGGVGVPLALPDFQRQVDNKFLYTTIRMGRPGRVMPAFTSLSDEQVYKIIHYIRSFTHVKAPKRNPARIHGNIARGKQLFAQDCAVCHGDHGQGGKGTGVTFSRPRNLPILAPALNNAGFLASATDTMIKNTLLEGRKGTPMNPFKGKKVKMQDIDDLVAYVRSFQKDLKPEPNENEPMTMVYEASQSLDKVVAAIKRAAIGRNFKIIRVQTMDSGFVPPDKESKKEVIVYFCNFELLNKALAIDPRVGLFLPCRVTAYEQNGVVKVAAINPKRLSHMFNNNELNKLCDHMYQVYSDILDEATL